MLGFSVANLDPRSSDCNFYVRSASDGGGGIFTFGVLYSAIKDLSSALVFSGLAGSHVSSWRAERSYRAFQKLSV